jgi:hypothetical protein
MHDLRAEPNARPDVLCRALELQRGRDALYLEC